MTSTLEHHWTHNGIECAVIHIPSSWNGGHRCGYVRIPEGHPWHGINYNQQVPGATPNQSRTANPDTLGLGGMLAVLGGTTDYMTRLEGLVEVHGGLTFGAGKPNIDLEGEDWIGFDCAHAGDEAWYWSQLRVSEETERLADQVVAAATQEAAR